MSVTRGWALLAGGFVLALGTSLPQTMPARAAVNCTAPGRPAGCVARPVHGGEAGAPGAGFRPGRASERPVSVQNPAWVLERPVPVPSRPTAAVP